MVGLVGLLAKFAWFVEVDTKHLCAYFDSIKPITTPPTPTNPNKFYNEAVEEIRALNRGKN